MSEKSQDRMRISLQSQPRYIYALIDPRDDTVRYVGVTKNVYYRLGQHVKGISKADSKGKWIAELEQLGLTPELEVLETIDACQDIDRIASEREKHWIHQFLELGIPLLNTANTVIPPPARSQQDSDTKKSNIQHAPFKAARIKANLTTAQLSEEARVSTTFIWHIEQSKPVKVELAVRACRVLSRHLGYEVTYQSLGIRVWGV